MYQIHVMLLGQPKALARVTCVNYRLDDAYPPERRTPSIVDKTRNFGFYELANGYSLVTAVVKIEGQARAVSLSRFVNLTEVGPNLNQQFVAE